MFASTVSKKIVGIMIDISSIITIVITEELELILMTRLSTALIETSILMIVKNLALTCVTLLTWTIVTSSAVESITVIRRNAGLGVLTWTLMTLTTSAQLETVVVKPNSPCCATPINIQDVNLFAEMMSVLMTVLFAELSVKGSLLIKARRPIGYKSE